MLKVFKRVMILQSPKIVASSTQCHCQHLSSTKIEKFATEDLQKEAQEEGMNVVQLMGRIAEDPQQIKTKAKDFEFTYVGFPLATIQHHDKPFSGTTIRKTLIHDIMTVYPRQQEYVLNYLSKGDKVFIHGEISYQLQDQQVKTMIRASRIVVADKVWKNKEDPFVNSRENGTEI